MRAGGSTRAALTALVLVVSAGCGSGDGPAAAPTPAGAADAADCRATVDALLGLTQRYLDGIDDTSVEGGRVDDVDAPLDEQEYSQAIGNLRTYADSVGCPREQFEQRLRQGLGALDTGGPLARAVLLQLQAGPAATRPRTVALAPEQDLERLLATLPDGSTVQLEQGRYALPERLTLLRGVTLRGAGRDRTTLVAASGGTVVLTAEPVRLEELAVVSQEGATGSLLTAAPTATVTLSRVALSGAREQADGGGGIAVLLAAGPAAQPGVQRRTTLTATDVELRDNAVAGVVVAGEHRAALDQIVVERSGQCGVCFLDSSDGSLRRGQVTDSDAGVVVAGSSRPLVESSTFTGGEVGVQAADEAQPSVTGNTVTGSRRAGLIWVGQARGRIDANTCRDVPAGLAVADTAAPDVGENDCDVVRAG